MKFNFKTSNAFFWILLSLLLKGVYFWTRIYLNYNSNQPLIGYFNKDSVEYYNSIENFFLNGVYSPDVRMPGLGIIYLLLRPLFEKTLTLNIIIVLQWIVSSFAAYLLALTISKVVKKESVFYFIYFLNALTPFIIIWSIILLTESFCISFFIFSLYYLNRFYETNSKKYLFWCGLFLTWCVFLRPVFFLFYGIICLFILWHFFKEKINFKTLIFNCLILLSVFIVLDSVWTIRNYNKKDKFIFLNDIDPYMHINRSDPFSALQIFLRSWGGDIDTEVNWFEVDEGVDFHKTDTTLPEQIFTSQFNRDSLRIVKFRLQEFQRHPSDSITALINNSLRNFTQSIKTEKPYLFYFGSGVKYLKKLIYQGSANFNLSQKEFKELSFIKKIYKISLSFLFYFIFSTGIIASFWFFIKPQKNHFITMLGTIGVINIIYIAFIFRYPEFRYLQPSTLVFMCITGIVLDKGFEIIKRKITSAKQ